MLLRFSVENYQSFRDQVTLELTPGSGKDDADHIIQDAGGNNSALNSILIYGANASGKSALFKAMTLALNILRRSSSVQSNEKLPWNPFMLNASGRNKPTSFEFQFVADNGIRYVYGFSYLPDHITEEYLLAYYSSRASTVFEYKNDAFRFTAKYAALFNPLVKMNARNRLFLATADAWNAEPVKDAYDWLTTKITTFTEVQDLSNGALRIYEDESNRGERGFVNFAVKMMKETDINISDIDLSFSDMSVSESGHKLATYQVRAHHLAEGRDYLIPLENESLGTRNIFFMAPFLC